MKTYQVSTYKADSEMPVDVLESIGYHCHWISWFLKEISRLLGKRYPGYYTALLQGMTAASTPLIQSAASKLRTNGIDTSILADDLLLGVVHMYFRKLDVSEPTDLEALKSWQTRKDLFLSAWLGINFCIAKTLETALPREQAIATYKALITKKTQENPNWDEKDKLSELLWSRSPLPELFRDSFDAVEFELDDGRVGMRIQRCRWAETLAQFQDPEFAYAVSCHNDFAAVARTNKNFALTRTQTLTLGNSFCDFCFHDRRMHKDLEHPDHDFWNCF